MAQVVHAERALSTNPLKASAPLGAAIAYLGIEGGIPLFHGAQGCTAFALVALVRHFKEAIPLQTTAMNEISAILGGAEQVEEAIGNLVARAQPGFIGIASTALTETRGEDVAHELAAMRARRPDLADTAIVYAATPDYTGGLEDGFAAAVEAIVETLVPAGPAADLRPEQVNLLVGGHLNPADVEAITQLVEAFGLEPIVLPDISRSLDGHVADEWRGTALGGARLDDIRAMGASAGTLVVGERLRAAGERLAARTGVPAQVFPSLTGLAAVDDFVAALMAIARTTHVPESIRRARARLVDAALDAHLHTGGLKVAIAAEPDLLVALAGTLQRMGAEIVAAVTTAASPALARLPIDEVVVGDLGDLEVLAAQRGADLLLTHAHGRQAAARLGLPLIRAGFPVFDRLGAQDVCRVGYAGSRAFLYEVANAVLAQAHEPKPQDWGAHPVATEFDHVRPPVATPA
ncbi:MAG: nitrogenase iron-molybdenum cofactor biosynthesis protein NifN [Geminicoccaceae bacterium]|nr:MAG: nitrogenase iron-molybdenum cofactor biosynthesis protein NifN [Geminicoccaceae bacterium]